MPANVTHMLIAHKALQKLKTKGIDEFTEFAGVLDDASRNKNYKAYMNLGSLGPDLYYYTKIFSSIKDLLKEGFVQAKGVTPWSYHLHSHKPNEFPLKLVEIIFSDVIREKGKVKLYEDDIRKLAYIAGHLTHIAADQIIHPIVNSVAGPYYRRGKNRKKHRECEIFQDYFLYEEVYRLEEKSGSKYDFFKQNFNRWADCVKGITTRNTEEWFRYFLQRGFVETYSACPTEEDIENSVDNLLLTLRVCQKVGPYKKADKEYRKNKDGSVMFQEYIKDVNYIKFYRLAVELAVIYLIALYEVYFVLKQGQDFTDQHKKRFLSIVSDADLSCPLKQNIFEKARAALRNKSSMEAAVKTHTARLLAKTKFITTNRIFKTSSDRDIVKA
ncbi:MAG: zinc dependent phospholipase C family protein [Planctomycetes bacterium]|nr:zinc dependent phospholipase C family protein [Planctomycetota bacterium]MCH8118832.1 zinc dependent phospholipase C family protein [Planctomycetota bacterium]